MFSASKVTADEVVIADTETIISLSPVPMKEHHEGTLRLKPARRMSQTQSVKGER